MTNKTHTYRQKGRAVFLAAIMVLSVVAMSATFAGAAAAANTDSSIGSFPDQVLTNDDTELTVYGVNVEGSTDGEVVITNSTDTVVGITGGLAPGSTNGDDIVVSVSELPASPDVSEGYNAYIVDDGSATVGNQFSPSSPPAQDSNTVLHQAYEVTNIDAPGVAFHGQEIGVTATVENIGVASVTPEDIRLNDTSGSTIIDEATGVSIDPGTSTSFEFTANTSTDFANSNANDKVTETIQVAGNVSGLQTAGFGTASTNTSNVDLGLTQDVIVGVDNEGELTVEVQRKDTGEPLADATVELYKEDDWSGDKASSGPPLRTVDLSQVPDNQDTIHTFENLAMGNSSNGTTVDYVFRADRQSFSSETDKVGLEDPDTTGPTRALSLDVDVSPNVLGVGVWDSDKEEVVNDAASLFANNEFDNQVEFVVFSQTESPEENFQPLQEDLDVTLETGATDANGNTGDEIVDNFLVTDQVNENTDNTLSVTIGPNSPVANVDDNSTTGDFSYETFNVSADVAETALDNAGEPIATEIFNATADIGTTDVPTAGGYELAETQVTDQPNFADNPITNNVTFFVEGDKATRHVVYDQETGDRIDNAQVWAAYTGTGQTINDAQNLTNAQGEAFLVAEASAGADGEYIIDGLVEDQSFNVYVRAPNYNIIDPTTVGTTIGSNTNEFLADYTLGETITAGEGGGEQYEMTHPLQETASAYDLDVTAADENGNQQKSVSVSDGDATEVQVRVRQGDIGNNDLSTFSPAANQQVELSLVDTGDGTNFGTLATQTVTTDSNGIANTTFQSVEGASGTLNVTASTVNADGEEYNTTANDPRPYNNVGNQSEIEVFTTGTITGDIVDDTDSARNVENADVFLYEADGSGAPVGGVIDQVTSGSDGSYTFAELQTGQDYRVEANITFNGTTYEGFAITQTLTAGTNGGVDVVLNNLDLSEVEGSEDAWYADYVDDSGAVTDDGLDTAVNDYLTGDLSDDRFDTVVNSYLTGDPIESDS